MKAAKFTTHRGGRRHVCCLSVRLSDLLVLGFGCIFIKVHVATLTACCKCVCLEGGKSDIFDNAKKEKRICDCQRIKLYGEPTVSRVEWESHWLSLLSH